MPDSLLRILNICLLALLLLFFLRVLRAVWVQVNAPPLPPRSPAAPFAGPPPGAGRVPAAAHTGGGGGILRLRVIEPPDRRGQVYDLGEEMTVGRAPGCGVQLVDPTVSQLHARVFRRDGSLYVEDLGSTNGTWVNRSPVTGPAALRRGDRVQFGSTVVEVAR